MPKRNGSSTVVTPACKNAARCIAGRAIASISSARLAHTSPVRLALNSAYSATDILSANRSAFAATALCCSYQRAMRPIVACTSDCVRKIELRCLATKTKFPPKVSNARPSDGGAAALATPSMLVAMLKGTARLRPSMPCTRSGTALSMNAVMALDLCDIRESFSWSLRSSKRLFLRKRLFCSSIRSCSRSASANFDNVVLASNSTSADTGPAMWAAARAAAALVWTSKSMAADMSSDTSVSATVRAVGATSGWSGTDVTIPSASRFTSPPVARVVWRFLRCILLQCDIF